VYWFLLAGVISAGSLGAYAQAEEPAKDSIQIMQEDIENLQSGVKKLQKLKISGYFQVQSEFAQEWASTKVGGTTSYQANRDSEKGNFHRFGVRRGRVKITWDESMGQAVFQLDMTENGVGIKDAYVKVWDPWLKIVTLTGGVFDRPFGDEISYSSSRRESPERSQVFQALFPDERDLGVMLTLAAPKGSAIEGLKLDAGLFCGNGIRRNEHGRMSDLIAHLKYDKKWSKIAFGIGASLYHGKVNNGDTLRWTVEDSKWTSEIVEKNHLNKRQYFGLDAQFSVETKWGITNIRGEYLLGTQPSTPGAFNSPRGNPNTYGMVNPADFFSHLRKFTGGHVYFIQDIYKTPLTVVFKYGYLNPNTEIKGNAVSNRTDIANNYYGMGLLWKVTSYIRLQAYYDMAVNEKSDNVSITKTTAKQGTDRDYSKTVAANLFTLRLQYKF